MHAAVAGPFIEPRLFRRIIKLGLVDLADRYVGVIRGGGPYAKDKGDEEKLNKLRSEFEALDFEFSFRTPEEIEALDLNLSAYPDIEGD